MTPTFTTIPIETKALPPTDEVLLEEINEPFVNVSAYSDGAIRVNMQYANAELPCATPTAYLRKTVVDKLLEAKALLPKGFTFELFDAWRPYEVQLALFDAYRARLRAALPHVTEADITAKACEYVSFPDKSRQLSYPHSTGGAVDLTIVDSDGNRLPMGTEFDDFSNKAYTAWFEQNDDDEQIKTNRRLLHNVLCACGFTNYPAEWWHYDYGDTFWAFYTHRRALYTSKYDEVDVKNNG